MRAWAETPATLLTVGSRGMQWPMIANNATRQQAVPHKRLLHVRHEGAGKRPGGPTAYYGGGAPCTPCRWLMGALR